MRIWQVFFLVLVLVLLQGTLGQHIAIAGVAPDIGLAFVVAFSLLHDTNKTLFAAVAVGLLQDTLFGSILGLYTLGKVVAGYFLSYHRDKFFLDNYALPFLLTAVITILNEIYLISIRGMIYQVWGVGFLLNAILITLYNSVIAVIIYIILYRRRDTGDEKW